MPNNQDPSSGALAKRAQMAQRAQRAQRHKWRNGHSIIRTQQKNNFEKGTPRLKSYTS
jgi:hypothetical protein